MPIGEKKILGLIYLASTVILLVAVSCMPWWTVDDAFISYRYGRNLIQSGSITWNPGDSPPVEGSTGLLLPLISAIVLYLGLPILLTIKTISLIAMGWALTSVPTVLRRLGAHALTGAAACLFLACTPLMPMHALSGLETMIFTALLIGSLAAFIGKVQQPSEIRFQIRLSILLLLLGLCRPEGILFAGLLCGYSIYLIAYQAHNTHHPKQWILPYLVLLLLVLYWVSRAVYYGSFFPNSYHAKVFGGILNWESVIALAKFAGYYCLLPCVLLLYLKITVPGRVETAAKHVIVLLLLFIAICIGAYLHSNLWMNYGSRFFFPFLPLITIILAIHFDSHWKGSSGFRRLKSVGWAAGTLAALQLAVFGFRYHQECTFLNYYHAIVQEELIEAGKYVNKNLPPDATVISYMDAGALGYYSDRRIIDFGRLNDNYLAQQNPNEQQVRDYFFNQNAAAVIFSSKSADSLAYIPEAESIAADPRFAKYRFVRQWGNSKGYPYWQRLYVSTQSSD